MLVCGCRPLLLPSANEVAERLCFYTSLSFCPQGRGMSAPVHAGIHPRADTPRQTHTPGRHPTSRRLLLRTVRILLECILVNNSFIYNLTSSKKLLGRILLINYLSQVVRTCSKSLYIITIMINAKHLVSTEAEHP